MYIQAIQALLFLILPERVFDSLVRVDGRDDCDCEWGEELKEEPGLRPGKGKEVREVEESSRPGDERPVPSLRLAFSAMSLSPRM